eukprot:95442-Chlamydomonas_euryale.AAC.4
MAARTHTCMHTACLLAHLVGVLPQQRVAAARVGPYRRERDLVGRALLQQQPAGIVEEEDAEGSVEQPPGCGALESVARALVGVAHDLVGLVHHNALVLGHEVELRQSGACEPRTREGTGEGRGRGAAQPA